MQTQPRTVHTCVSATTILDVKVKMFKKLLKWGVILTVIAGIAGLSGVAGLFYYYGRDLPRIISRDDFTPPQMSRIYSAKGEVIGEYFTPGAKRTVVPLEKIPKHVRHAFMAAEDADFMSHQGIDYLGMLRAFYYAVRYDAGIKGTSTITQQVVKNLVLSPERSIKRKVQEIMLARELEKNLTKQDILYLYLNTIYLGHGVNGIEEAARLYFGKPASELTIPEAALIAGLTQSPERHTPFRHPERAAKRRAFVLEQLWEKGFIEEAAYRQANKTDLILADPQKATPYLDSAPFFVEHVRRILVDRYGSEKVREGGLRVHTTLRVDAQKTAKEAVRLGLHTYDDRRNYYRPTRKLTEKEIGKFIAQSAKTVGKRGLKKNALYDAVVTSVDSKGEKVSLKIGEYDGLLELVPRSRIFNDECKDKELGEILERGHLLRIQIIDPDVRPIRVRYAPGPEAALVSIDPKTRHVLAMTGGYDYEFNEYNHATQMRRQTGSTFKPFVYAAALEERIITPATVYLDSPAVFPLPGGKTWSPKNSDKSWRGPIRVREALGASRNVVAVRILKDLGIEKAHEFARRVGMKSELTDNFTLVMGSSELTPLEITNAYATFASGGIYAEPHFITRVETARGESETFDVRSERVLSEEVAYLISYLMTSVVHGYTDSKGRRRGGTAHSLAKLASTIAGKTGTTNDTRDAWFIGFTPKLVTGAWVGFDDNASLGHKEYGGRVAGPIWLHYMKEMHDEEEELDFEPPESGLTTALIDPRTGKLLREGGIEETFLVGTAPTEYAPSGESGSGDDFLLSQFGSEESEESPE